MATNYKAFPDHVPANGQAVYIRLFSTFNTGWAATYSSASKTFTVVFNNSTVPAYFVVEWKPR